MAVISNELGHNDIKSLMAQALTIMNYTSKKILAIWKKDKFRFKRRIYFR